MGIAGLNVIPALLEPGRMGAYEAAQRDIMTKAIKTVCTGCAPIAKAAASAVTAATGCSVKCRRQSRVGCVERDAYTLLLAGEASEARC